MNELLPDTPFVRLLLLEFDVLLDDDINVVEAELASMKTTEVIERSKLCPKHTDVSLSELNMLTLMNSVP